MATQALAANGKASVQILFLPVLDTKIFQKLTEYRC